MREHLRQLLFGTLRRQLIVAVACIHAVMMILFVWDLTVRQEDMLLARQTEHATALAQSVSVSTAGWLAARDIAGLQEIVEAQRRYPELRYAMVTERDGRILAHTEIARIGQYLGDLPAAAETRLMARSPTLVDVAAPVMLGQTHVGWIRVGIGQGLATIALTKITRDGILYAIAAIVIGVLLAWAMARRLTARLDAIQIAVDAVKSGDMSRRAEVIGSDEAARLAREFNVMLDTQVERDAELRNYRQHLENLVEQRTNALATARDAAEAANRAKSIFLANMSHELRTPLNAVLGFTQLLARDKRLVEEHRRQLDIIHKSGQNLLALINDVLEISRIESGRLAVNPQVFDLPGLLDALVESMAMRAGDKGLAIRLDCHDTLPHFVRADIGKLRQVLLNLLSNGVKYTQQGEVVLRASAVVQDGNAVLNFAVVDTGVGIEPDELGRLFQVFYQTRQGVLLGEGTGLGLAISREYVHLLGGTLEVQSTPGQGSVFSFSIPAEVAQAMDEKDAPPVALRGLVPGQPECRVLVAEDDPLSRDMLRRILEQAGFVVQVACDGAEAVDLFVTSQPHFVWMDMLMPHVDGYEATRRLRALPQPAGQPRVPIVALTASVFDEDRPAILAAGCDEVVRKPLQIDRLLDVMSRRLPTLQFQREDGAEDTDLGAALQIVMARSGNLAAGLQQRLHDAAINLDNEAARAVAAEIAPEHPELAVAIRVLCENYQVGRLADSVSGKGAG